MKNTPLRRNETISTGCKSGLAVFFAVLLCALCVFTAGGLDASQRKNKHASAANADLKNFHEFSRNIYRGAQPTAEGFAKIKKLGIKTVIDLMPGHSDEKLIEGLGFNYYQIPVKLWSTDSNTIIQFLKIVTNTKYYPVFIHCDDGVERCGLMAALFRIYAQNWTTYDATKEFCKTSPKKDWNTISGFLDGLDKPKIKRAILQ